MDKSALFKLSYGLFVVTANEGAKDNGCITNTVIQVTNDPLRISVTINKDNYTCGMIHRTGLFNVSILSEEASFEIFKHWGFQSGRDVDKALGIEFYRLENGVIYVTEGVNAVLCAKVAGNRSWLPHHVHRRPYGCFPYRKCSFCDIYLLPQEHQACSCKTEEQGLDLHDLRLHLRG